MRKLTLAAMGAIGAVAAYRTVVEPWWHTWGAVSPAPGTTYRGDDLVCDPNATETRSIAIDAPPDRVWPWLVQMGHGRAGWYSYDAIDTTGESAARIVPEWQRLAVGDVVPTHPGGGFLVRVLDPERALVLYSDTELVRHQAASAAARSADTADMPTNLRATSAILDVTQPTDFTASWAFILRPLDDGRTELIERFRVRFGATDKPWTRATLPFVGFGVFLMVRRQLLGIRERAEGEPGEAPTDDIAATGGPAAESPLPGPRPHDRELAAAGVAG